MENNLFNKKMIDLNKAILLYHNDINLSLEQTLFLLKIITFYPSNIIKITSVSKEMKISKNKIDELLADLIYLELLKIKKNKAKNEYSLNFSGLYNKLSTHFLFLEKNLNLNEKANWIINELSLEKSELVLITLEKWLKNDLWGDLKEIVDNINVNKKTSNVSNFSWSTFYSMMSEVELEKNNRDERINNILEENIIK